MDHHLQLDPKSAKKFPGYDDGLLGNLYGRAAYLLWNLEPRYATLKTYCNAQLQAYRQAREYQMPAGRVLTLSYEEYGFSRPRPIHYDLVRDTLSGRMLLLGCEKPRAQNELVQRPQVEVEDRVLEDVRSLIEEHKVYSAMRFYTSPPAFPDCPRPLGGPPSWHFNCQLEGGTVESSASHAPTLPGCQQLVAYFRKLLNEDDLDVPVLKQTSCVRTCVP